jgi:cytochrome P450
MHNVKAIPVARGLPLVGAAVDLLRDGPGFVTRLARRHPGEIVGFRLGPMTVYLVTQPEHVQQVLQTDARSYGKGSDIWKATRPLFGNGLVSSDGDFWRRQRRMMQPLFSAERLAALTDMMVEVIDRDLAALAQRGPGATVEIDREMGAVTQRVILETMFGPGIDRAETDRLGEHLQVAFKALNLRSFLSFLPDRLPLPGERRARASITAIDEAMMRLVRARRASGEERSDLLGLLLGARDDNQEGMDDRQLRDELVTMFVAGQETTANAMTWLWYALDQHPEVDARLRAEVDQVLGDRWPRFQDLARLEYTQRVIHEVMRLYPPAWMFARFADRDTTLGGHRIPKGAPLLLSPFVTHRDPELWPDPERFDPERFTAEQTAQRPRYAYYPFGGGPRQCIGNHFATMEAQLITAMMARRMRPRLVSGHPVSPSSVGTLKARHGMKMILDAPA